MSSASATRIWEQFFMCSHVGEDLLCRQDESDHEGEESEADAQSDNESMCSDQSDSDDDRVAIDLGQALREGWAALSSISSISAKDLFDQRLAVPPLGTLLGMLGHLQPLPALAPVCEDVEEFKQALRKAPADAKLQCLIDKPTCSGDALEGIWLGGMHGPVMDSLEEMALHEVDCRSFSSGRFRDRRAQGSLAFARNVRALRELAGDIHRARADGSVVYVHCAQGKNRGPAALVAYLLMYVRSVSSLEAAFALVTTLQKQARTGTNTFYQELLHICRAQGKTVASRRGR